MSRTLVLYPIGCTKGFNMKLFEDVIFGNNQLQTVKKILGQSQKNRIKTANSNEQQLVDSIVRNLGLSKSRFSEYLAIKAASYGADTNKNHSLYYLKSLSKNSGLVDGYSDKIDKVIDLIAKKEIAAYKDEFLTNESLYKRNDSDFEYAVRAFDAVLYKKNQYFDMDAKGRVDTSIEEDTRKVFFPDYREIDARSDYYSNWDSVGEGFGRRRLGKSVLVEEVRESLLPIDIKYFYANFKDGQIIPSGVNGSDDSKRTIWNYMELWSSPGEDDDRTSNSSSQAKKRAEKIIKANKNMSKEEQAELLDLIDDM